MKAVIALFLCAAAALVPQFAAGQAAPSAAGRANASLYGLFTGARPNYQNDWLLGATEGVSVQWKRFVGIDGRVSELRWGPSANHQYFGTIGPRVAFGNGRLSEYAAFEGGVAHVRYPYGVDGSGVAHSANATFAGVWTVNGGIDYRINPRFQIRVADFQYSNVYVLQGLNPKLLSAGVVWRFF